MKKLSASFISVLLIANFFTATAQKQQGNPYMSRTFPTSSIKSLEATTFGGSITLNGNATAQAIVEVFVNSSNKLSDEQLKQILEKNYTIEIKVENEKLYAIGKQKGKITDKKALGISISFKISVSKEADSRLRTSGGSIEINDISGSQDFATSGGSLFVENVSGNIVGRTSGGSITVTNSKDNIDLQTSGGSITATDCDGKIDITTSGGSIYMNNLNGKINAATSGGNVAADNINGVIKTGTSGGNINLYNISGSLDAKTSGGNIDVTMKLVSDYVKLSNSGNIALTIPTDKGYNLKVKANKIKTSGLSNFSGEIDDKNINGKIGNGGVKIEITTSSQAKLTFK